MSLNFYNRPPDFDLKQLFDSQMARYSLSPPLQDVHAYASFDHLNNYSAIYYTDVWSKAIALDLHTRFAGGGVRNPAVARRYRRMVLEPGGSEDANALIEHFRGRPLSIDAFRQRLQAGAGEGAGL